MIVHPKPATVTIESSGDGKVARIRLTGELEIASADAVRSKLAAARKDHPDRDFILDMSQLEFIDSTGLQVLLRFRRELKSDDRVMVLLGATGSVRRIFETTGLEDILLLASSLEQAERMLAGLHVGPPSV